MIKKAINTMTTHHMMPERSVLVALSGGADSVALLHMMCEISKKSGFCVYAAHINHGLRGEAADHDEEFSRQLCRGLGVEFFVKHADVRALAKEWGTGEEEAGRRVRYEFFSEVMNENHIEYTATAHHMNDNAETVLMNFLRGSGLGGLSGIPYKRDRYIRPLLDITRAEVEEYCRRNALEFVTDQTNADTVYTRNKIRNVLIPLIEREFNPGFVNTVTANAKVIAEADFELDVLAGEIYAACVSGTGDEPLCFSGVGAGSGADGGAVGTDSAGAPADLRCYADGGALVGRVIRKMIDKKCGLTDVPRSVICSIRELFTAGKTGKRIDIAADTAAWVEYGRLYIGTPEEKCPDFMYTIKVGERKFIPELGGEVRVMPAGDEAGSVAGGVVVRESFTLPDGTDEVMVSNRRSGDEFVPKGMNSHKSIKSFMIDNKIPQHLRSRIGILRIGGEIAWVIGYRRAAGFCGTSVERGRSVGVPTNLAEALRVGTSADLRYNVGAGADVGHGGSVRLCTAPQALDASDGAGVPGDGCCNGGVRVTVEFYKIV